MSRITDALLGNVFVNGVIVGEFLGLATAICAERARRRNQPEKGKYDPIRPNDESITSTLQLKAQ